MKKARGLPHMHPDVLIMLSYQYGLLGLRKNLYNHAKIETKVKSLCFDFRLDDLLLFLTAFQDGLRDCVHQF